VAFAALADFRGLAVCANGAVLLDLAMGGAVTGTWPMTAEVAIEAIRVIRSLVPGTVFATIGADELIAEPGYASLVAHGDHWLHPGEIHTADELVGVAAGTVKVVARHPELPPADLYRILAGAALANVELTHSLAPFVELAAAGVTKAATLAMIASERKIGIDEVVAIGDALNDLPMLEWAGTALAPANAVPEVLAIAKAILPSNDDDGVATYLESLLNLQ
jgi:hydroxymethylpyrimidine pyrophosphatase-like HAD family hydrolase